MSQGEILLAHQLMLTGMLKAASLEYRFAPPRRWRFDFAWPDRKVAVEVEGGSYVSGRHTRGAGFELDCEKYNEAVLHGWRVLRVTPHMIEDGRALALVERAINANP